MNSALKTTRFLHASDLHLGHLQFLNPERADDHIKALQQILWLAIKKECHFVVLGGDIFNSLDLLPQQFNKIVQVLQNFQKMTQGKIPIIAIEGNHDIRRYSRNYRIQNNQSWLATLHQLNLIILLKGEYHLEEYNKEKKQGNWIQIQNCRIFGITFQKETTEKNIISFTNQIKQLEEKTETRLYNIFIMHLGIKGQMIDVPGVPYHEIEPLRETVNYLALGHFHLQYTIGNWIFNPGSSEAIGFHEYKMRRGVFFAETIFRKENERNNLPNNDFGHKISMIPLKNREYKEHTLIIPVFIGENRLLPHIQETINKTKKLIQDIKNQKILVLTIRSSFELSEKLKKSLKKELIRHFKMIDLYIYSQVQEAPKLENYFPTKFPINLSTKDPLLL